jgi:transcriptional regulator with XRE-family HTH domain
MYDINMENLGKKIRYFRKAKNLSTEELGKAINKNKTTIVRYENNEILPDILTSIELCNALNIDLNDLCDFSMHDVQNDISHNPFNNDLLYLYYISKNGIVISSLEITKTKYTNYVLMKNGLTNTKYKQEYTGVMECSYNTAFICLTNAISNPRLR